jgi:hypothetical protein
MDILYPHSSPGSPPLSPRHHAQWWPSLHSRQPARHGNAGFREEDTAPWRAAEGRASQCGSKECTRLNTCTRNAPRAGKAVDRCPRYFAGVKQAEAEGQSMERSVRRPSEGRRSVPAWRQIAKGAAGATAEPRALKQQGVSATESLAPKHPLTDPLTGSREINLLPALQRLSMPADERPRQDDGPPAHRHPPPKQVIPWPRRVAVPPDNAQSTSPAPSGPTQCKLQAADKLRGG